MENLTTSQASKESGVPEGTLRYWRSRDEGPPSFRIGARRVMYRRSDLEAWMQAQYDATVTGDTAA
ncbi:helix-turn-helix transcriptional regulator [Corynebacterium sputi]|uniref:helix-turn-helix transcriptional regulator n=1 Tax=Corynebacterium sputi TaxID=489915 RepID=UPI0004234344|nr:helix-turn-helix domain-containing protein [Corynebacterium sputi]